MPHFVPANGFTQQVAEFTKQLEYITDDEVLVDDDGASPTRHTSYFVQIPDDRTGVATMFDYREEFRKVVGGWLRSRYAFELRVSRPNSSDLNRRKAHHQHDPWGIHQHCETPSDPRGSHYADVERLLQATHELFVRQIVGGSPINCTGLVALPNP